IAYFQQVERAHGRVLDHAGLVRAAADRLAPILMTALVTGIALLPLLLLGGRAGGEIEQPMALVIVGGLFTSTWLNLFVVPVWYASVPTPPGARPRVPPSTVSAGTTSKPRRASWRRASAASTSDTVTRALGAAYFSKKEAPATRSGSPVKLFGVRTATVRDSSGGGGAATGCVQPRARARSASWCLTAGLRWRRRATRAVAAWRRGRGGRAPARRQVRRACGARRPGWRPAPPRSR